MADLNVLIAFDAATIVEQNPNASRNPDAPTYADHSLIYMTTRHDHIVGTSGAELNLRAEPGDSIRWRETTLSLGSDYKALLYKYVSSDTGHQLVRTPETYHFYFQILDRHRQLKGYFQWDPFITIENP
ncbi:AidA/PixA family protein [Streptomyces tailanensis]|uniref:AidA/PixA family protein n=1 Tax=Streptomyces tailanensis TaxID=2569858 RepID=UPI00122DDA3B|nr:AidA/PixA family protein [Streptomyces tailanensis]